MADMTPQPVHDLDRRALLRRGLLIGGMTVFGVASSALPAAARTAPAPRYASANQPTKLVVNPNDISSVQWSWAWCNKCKGLFYGPHQGSSVCPAGRQHSGTGSFNYAMFYDYLPASSDPQQDWSWCNKCRGLFYGPHQSSSWCPAGGQHSGTGSFNYAIFHADTFDVPFQPNWAWCHKCRGLFYAPHASSSWCPSNANARHDATGSLNYDLFYDNSTPPV